MIPLPSIGLSLAATLACATKDCPPGSYRADATGLCTLFDEDTGFTGDGGSTDGGSGTGPTGGELGLVEGDPITTSGSFSDQSILFSEFTGVAIIDDSQAILTGVAGFAIADMITGEWTTTWEGDRGHKIAYSDGWGWIIGGDRGLYPVDLSDPTDPEVYGTIWGSEKWTYSVAASSTVVAVAHGSDGVLLYDTTDVLSDLAPIHTIDGEEAAAVAILGDTLAIVDGDQLQLYDISSPTSPVELSTTTLSSGGAAVDLTDDWLVVGLGGAGVQTFSRSDAGLEDTGSFTIPGSAVDIAIDGDDVWVAGWGIVALARLTPRGPITLGHEDSTESAFAIDAINGQAMVADWFYSTAMTRVDGTGGPEIVISDTLWFPDDEAVSQRLEVRNYGAFDLEVDLSDSEGNYTLDADAVTLAPGESQVVLVSGQGDGDEGEVRWTSNDPDESSGRVDFQLAEDAIGSPHMDFSLEGFAWPDPNLSVYTLDQIQGQVTFVAYWATF